mgnify:CR=1 FL=1
MVRVGIVGATGYAGAELVRILSGHPQVELSILTSRQFAGVRFEQVYPALAGSVRLTCEELDVAKVCDLADIVFLALPHRLPMTLVPQFLERNLRVVDLSADFRFNDAAVYEAAYQPHTAKDLLAQAVYGLSEIYAEAIRTANLIGNPGCYPTAVQLGFLPLLEAGCVDAAALIADCKSGVSGAGRKASVGTLLAEASESFKAYAVPGHRHLPEICQGLEQLRGAPVGLTFVPHLTPMIRGIHATLYAPLERAEADMQAMFESRFHDEPFVDVLPAGSHPETRTVRGANHCRIAVHRPPGGQTVVVLAVIDNLVKGAAGQAVQNMNIMFCLEETCGLQAIGLLP